MKLKQLPPVRKGSLIRIKGKDEGFNVFELFALVTKADTEGRLVEFVWEHGGIEGGFDTNPITEDEDGFVVIIF